MNPGTLKGFAERPSRAMRVVAVPQGFSAGSGELSILGPRNTTASGAGTAGVWTNVLQVRGGGMLKAVTLRNANGASKTMSLRIVMDGTEVFNYPVASATAATFAAIGQIVSSTVLDDPLPFYRDLLIQYKADVSETDGATIEYRYDARR